MKKAAKKTKRKQKAQPPPEIKFISHRKKTLRAAISQVKTIMPEFLEAIDATESLEAYRNLMRALRREERKS